MFLQPSGQAKVRQFNLVLCNDQDIASSYITMDVVLGLQVDHGWAQLTYVLKQSSPRNTGAIDQQELSQLQTTLMWDNIKGSYDRLCTQEPFDKPYATQKLNTYISMWC